MSFFSNILGTTKDTFRLAKKWIIDGSAATAQRTINLGNANINLSSPTSGQALVFNGTQWLPQTISGGGSGDGNIIIKAYTVNYNSGSTSGALPGFRRFKLIDIESNDILLNIKLYLIQTFNNVPNLSDGGYYPPFLTDQTNGIMFYFNDYAINTDLATTSPLSGSWYGTVDEDLQLSEYGSTDSIYLQWPDGATSGSISVLLSYAKG